MRKSLRKGMLLLAVTVILMFLVAAGIDSAGISLIETVGQSVLSAVDAHSAMILLFTAWLFTVGMLCRTLKKIPGLKSGRSVPQTRHN
jgi:hypothetical protein